MESVAPPLELLIEVKSAMSNGHSARSGITKYLDTHSGEFRDFVFYWKMVIEQRPEHDDANDLLRQIKSPYRRSLLKTLRRGLKGASIMPILNELEEEIKKASEYEIDKYTATLPVKMLLPLLLFQFPAFLLLLLGPVLRKLLEGVL